MSLEHYHRKRNFKKTREPYGMKAAKRGRLYIIQKHAASHLHYDLRLELDGVLKSWAIPKGPSLDPSIKHLAVHVEDHPIEYGSFEGTIPKGQYGGGTVMLWDRGEWTPVDNKHTYYSGDFTFELKGKKLKGLWKLVRIKNNPKNWLLIKINDKFAHSESEYKIIEAKPRSVLSHKSLEGIAKSSKDGLTTKAKPKKSKSLASNNKILTYPFTNPQRVLYPEQDITKYELAEFYYGIQDLILPHIRQRPLALMRCPKGHQENCFFQKHTYEYMPDGIFGVAIQEKSKKTNYIYIKDFRGLIGLVQIGVLEIHPWGSTIRSIEKPNQITFDLDPAPHVPWKKVVDTAFFLKEQLELMNLKSFVKTTGGKGLHVIIPIQRRFSWNEIKIITRAIAKYIVNLKPNEYVSTMTKSKRQGKIFIDHFRNNRGATAIAAYSTRARQNAPVATPLSWHELSPKISSMSFTIHNFNERLKKLTKDPWEDFFSVRQHLTQAIKFLGKNS